MLLCWSQLLGPARILRNRKKLNSVNKKWIWNLNLWPPDYKSDALPTELIGLTCFSCRNCSQEKENLSCLNFRQFYFCGDNNVVGIASFQLSVTLFVTTVKQKSHATKTTKVNPGNQSQLQYMPIHAAGKLSVGTPFWPFSVSQYLSTTLFTTQSAVEDSQLNKSRMNSSGS